MLCFSILWTTGVKSSITMLDLGLFLQCCNISHVMINMTLPKKNRLHLEHNKNINNNSNTYLVSFRKENNRMLILFIQFLQCTLLKKSHISCVGWFFSKSGAKATIICSCASCEIVDAFWKQIQTKMSQPNKHEIMNQCCFNVGPALQTMGQN